MAWLVILWLACAYLLVLGLVMIAAPARANRFLSGFAQTRRANFVESALRLMVGVAFIGAAPNLRISGFALVFGAFLALTAVLMVVFPELHRRFARQATSTVSRGARLVGIGSIVLAGLLAALIV